jgi:hypothetical protein
MSEKKVNVKVICSDCLDDEVEDCEMVGNPNMIIPEPNSQERGYICKSCGTRVNVKLVFGEKEYSSKIIAKEETTEWREEIRNAIRAKFYLFPRRNGFSSWTKLQERIFERLISDDLALDDFIIFSGMGTGKTFFFEQLEKFMHGMQSKMTEDEFKKMQKLDSEKRNELLPKEMVEELITGRFGSWDPKDCTHTQIEEFVLKNNIEIRWCKDCGALGIEELTNFDSSHTVGEKIMIWEIPLCNKENK